MIGKLLTTTAVLLMFAGAANAQSTTPADNAAAPAATAPAPTAGAANNGGIDVASLKPTDMTAMKVDDIKGVDVLDPAGQKIASINDLVLTADGKVDAVIVDFGGFLGIGTKQIALGYDGLQFMDDANGKHFLVVNTSKDQLTAAQAYNKDDYASNRDAERLMVGSPAGQTAAATTTDAAAATPAPAMAADANKAAAPGTAPAGAMDAAGFATKAGTANMFEIEESQAALGKLQNADVKTFAQKMIDDHTKAGDEMKTAATTEKVTPPTALDADSQAKIDALNKASGDALDKQYVADQLKAHQEAVALFTDYSKNGPAGALKDFATKTLPTLQMHLDMVQKLPQ